MRTNQWLCILMLFIIGSALFLFAKDVTEPLVKNIMYILGIFTMASGVIVALYFIIPKITNSSDNNKGQTHSHAEQKERQIGDRSEQRERQMIDEYAEQKATPARVATFDVMITDFGENKISAIKVVREITGVGLKEAKDLVEACPVVIKQNISPNDAAEFAKRLQEAGCIVDVRPSAP